MIRRAYAIPLRRRIVADANEIGIKRAAEKWRVSRSNLYRWVQQTEKRRSTPTKVALRATVDAIVKDVAEKYGVAEAYITASESPQARPVRAEAWRQIIKATGCSMHSLAEVWGCHPQTVSYSMKEFEAETEGLLRLLEWSHGPSKALQIVLGRDPFTNNDIAAWNGLGSGRAAA